MREFSTTSVISKQTKPSNVLRKEIVAEKKHLVPDYTLTYVPQGKGMISAQKGPVSEEDKKEWDEVMKQKSHN